MQEYEQLGHMTKVEEYFEPDTTYYIPHHGVYRPKKSSTKEFRKQPIAITADIEKTYRIILITPSQRDYLQILWKSDKNDPVSTYRLNTVTYGTTSAPLATRTLKQIAIDNREKFPAAAEILETDFNVDDLVSSVSNIETGKEIQKQLIELLSCAGMKLHKWSSNSKDILRELPYEAKEYHFDRDEALQGLKVQRFVFIENYKSLELHGFLDVSEKAFGASIYLRCTNSSEQSSMRLFCSKSRTAPIKRISIPRLELCAAGLLSKLMKKVIASLKLKFDGVYLWTDSTIALGGLQTDPWLLKTFVGNRVSQIQEITKSYCWQHIRLQRNPSDLVSRGLSAENLVNWKGSETFCYSLPHSEVTLDSKSGDFTKELKKEL
ncbi:integrase catalytic domain-containing protein [Trichonephila clavipes]|uniref:Integrase catalytic domain-containing protein n=1 Tax=Trichonephila clavipes TaxID=2585209 RepID=A0A8X6RHV4_TRICX|nr:integrase catalytic domain-containing protein [Trichonephila clavipes]